jgi:type III pantothenate kinase
MILLDIGNTHSRIAVAEGDKITVLRTLCTEELSLQDIPEDKEGAWGASVVPAAAARLEKVTFINAALAGKILDFSCVDSTTIGADRLANAVAALDYGTPVLVLDCGSAVTIELVDSQKRFLGGAIAPGRKMLRRALHTDTAQLPEIPLSSRLPVFPGPNTAEALRFGIDRGAAGAARELIEACDKCYGKFNKIVTGGDAEFFALALDLPAAPVDFTLRGVLKIARAHQES